MKDVIADKGPGNYFIRYVPSIVGAVGLIFFALLCSLPNPDLYRTLLRLIGIVPYHYPFVDLNSILRAIECARNGTDVFVPNSCMSGGVYSYSPFLLRAGSLPIGTSDRVAGGLLIDLAFLMSLSLLPPPRSRTELWSRLAAVIATDTVFALERGNLDLLIFVMAASGTVLVCQSAFLRFIGYAVFVLAAILKFYPATLLMLAIRERLGTLLAVTVSALAIAIVFLVQFGRSTATAVQAIPFGSPFGACFGALNLPFGIGFLLSGPTSPEALDKYRMSPAVEFVYAGMRLGAVVLACRTAWRKRDPLSGVEPLSHAFLVGGAALVAGCFFAAQNVGYRGIFLIFVLPGLWSLARADRTGQGNRAHRLIAAILFLMWEEVPRQALYSLAPKLFGPALGFSLQIFFWVGRELVWWWVVIGLMSLLITYLMTAFAAMRGTVSGMRTSLP